MQEENTGLKKQVERFESAQIRLQGESLAQKAESLNGIQFVGAVVEAGNAEGLKKLAFDLKQRLKKPVIALAASIDGKSSVVLLFDESVAAEKGLDASALIKQKIALIIKGGGGGQKTLATAGGQDVSALHEVIQTVKSLL
jgi:alanyl-tRNA synthetase